MTLSRILSLLYYSLFCDYCESTQLQQQLPLGLSEWSVYDVAPVSRHSLLTLEHVVMECSEYEEERISLREF